MPPSLISLPPEILCNILKKLSIESCRSLLASCHEVYDNGKYAFDQKCFSIIPLTLENEAILQAEELTREQPCCFLEEIVIWIDRECNDRPESVKKNAERLLSVFTNAHQVSTKFNTITIRYDPDEFDEEEGRYVTHTKAVVWAIDNFAGEYERTNLKIQIENIRLYDCNTLLTLGQTFLNRVYSVGIRIQFYDTTARSIQELLPLATNLKEFSLLNESDETLSFNFILKIMKKLSSKPLESITLGGIETNTDQLKKILHPLKASLKSIKLQDVAFEQESFESFVCYISRNYSLNDFDLKGIYENHGTKLHEVIDPMSYWHDLQN